MKGALAGFRDPQLGGVQQNDYFPFRRIQPTEALELRKQAEQRLTRLQIKSPAERLPHHATPVAC